MRRLTKVFLPEEVLLDKERQAELLKVMKSLSKSQSEIIFMYYLRI